MWQDWTKLGGVRGKKWLTEHGLQAHEAADEVVEVDGQVGLCVAGDDQLVQLFVQFVAFLGGKNQKTKQTTHLKSTKRQAEGQGNSLKLGQC